MRLIESFKDNLIFHPSSHLNEHELGGGGEP